MRVLLGGDVLTVSDLFSQLATINGQTMEISGHDRTVLIDKVGEFHVALLVTVRDHRRWMEMHRIGGKLRLEAKEIEEGRQPVDVNFLAVHEITGRGLWRSYRGSMNVPTLTRVFARQHNALVKKRREQWIEDAVANGAKKTKAGREAVARIPHEFTIAQIVRTENLPQLLGRLTGVQSFQVDLEGLTSASSSFQPLKSSVQTTRYKLKFKPHLEAKPIVQRILELIKREKPVKGRVVGSENGEERSYDISEIPATVFDEEDFDTTALTFDPEQFKTSWPIKKMVRTMRAASNIFATTTP